MTSTPPNNLKERLTNELGKFFTAMCQSQGSDTPVSDERRDKEKAATQILNLILDTILAEIGEAPEDTDKYGNELLGKWLERGRIRTMLEGLRT